MITFRTMAGAILTNGGDVLLMKRSEERAFYPGVWAPVGGHVEPGEINCPQAACLREICEETGLAPEDIDSLTLRYIVLRRSKDEIRVSHVYAAETRRRDVTHCVEGELHWVSRAEATNRRMSAFTRLVLCRFLEYGDEPEVLVGALVFADRGPCIDWMPLEGWEGL